MKNYFNLVVALLCLLSSYQAGAGCEEELDVGDRVIEKAYLSFDGCEHEKAYSVGSYVFICGSYDYSYNYGEVVLFDNGVLCVDGEAYEGTIRSKEGKLFPDPNERLHKLLQRLPPAQREELKKKHDIK